MNPLSKYRGKKVFIYTLSGAKYGGELYLWGRDGIVLRKLEIWCKATQEFATVISKSNTIRHFKVSHISKIEEQP